MERALRIIRPNKYNSCMDCPVAARAIDEAAPCVEGGVLTEVALRCEQTAGVIFMGVQTTEVVADYKGQGMRIVTHKEPGTPVDCPGDEEEQQQA